MKPSPDNNSEIGYLDSKIRSRLKRSVAIYNPPPDGKQRLMRKILHPDTPAEKPDRFWENLMEFFTLSNQDPQSLALSETIALSKTRVFGLPGAQSLNMI